MAAVGIAVCTAACTAAVPVEPPAAAPGALAVCERLASALPARVEGQRRRDVDPADRLTAAWGDPAIVLRCGVPEPTVVDPSGLPAPGVEGVTWSARKLADGYLFTTVRRTANVEVLVPGRYAPEVNPLVDLAAAIKAAVPCAPGTTGAECD